MARDVEYFDHPTALKIWRVISALWLHEGVAPSYRDIANSAHCSTGTVERHLWRLAKAGRIDWVPGRHRSIKVLILHPDAERRHREGLERERRWAEQERLSPVGSGRRGPGRGW